MAAGRAPSPFVRPGPFTAVWEGTLGPELGGAYRLHAELAGSLVVEIDGERVLEGHGPAASSAAVRLKKEGSRFRATFTAPASGDAFVRLGWSDERGRNSEPVPARAFRHEPDAALAAAAKRRLGRSVFIERRCGRCHVAPDTGNPELAMDAPRWPGSARARPGGWRPGSAIPRRARRRVGWGPRRGCRRCSTAPTPRRTPRRLPAYLVTLGAPPAVGVGAPEPDAPATVAVGERLWRDRQLRGLPQPAAAATVRRRCASPSAG